MLGCKPIDTLIEQNHMLEVAYLRNGIFISQQNNIFDLKKNGMFNYKPIERKHKLGEALEDVVVDKESY